MELKEFVKNVINDLTSAVEEINQSSKCKTSLAKAHDNKTIEFDIAVTTEDSKNSADKAGVKILQFVVEGDFGESREIKNSSASRIRFGVYVSNESKIEEEKAREKYESLKREYYDR